MAEEEQQVSKAQLALFKTSVEQCENELKPMHETPCRAPGPQFPGMLQAWGYSATRTAFHPGRSGWAHISNWTDEQRERVRVFFDAMML